MMQQKGHSCMSQRGEVQVQVHPSQEGNQTVRNSQGADRCAGLSMWVFSSNPLTASMKFSQENKGGHQLHKNGKESTKSLRRKKRLGNIL